MIYMAPVMNAEIKAESLKDSKDAAEIMNCVNSIKAIKAQIALDCHTLEFLANV